MDASGHYVIFNEVVYIFLLWYYRNHNIPMSYFWHIGSKYENRVDGITYQDLGNTFLYPRLIFNFPHGNITEHRYQI